MKSQYYRFLFGLAALLMVAVPFASAQSVSSFAMLDSNGQTMIDPIVNNQMIFLNQLSSQQFTFRANTTGSVAQVRFYLTNVNTHTQVGVSTDTSAPFTVCSSSDCSVYFPAGSSSCGTAYLLQAVPYSSSGGSLVAGTPFSLSFTMAPGGGLTMAQDSGGNNVTITPPANDNRILIDDGPAFSKPIVDQSFSTSSLAISNILSSGLVQGI